MVRVTSSVRRRWREMDGHVAVLVKTGLALDDAERLAEVVADELSAAYEMQDVDPVQFSVQRTPKGPAIFLEDCGDLDRVLNRMADALAARGCDDATLTAVPIVRPYHGHGIAVDPRDEMGSINGYLAIRGAQRLEHRLRRWDVDDADAYEALRELLDWALALPGAEPVVDVCTGKYYTRVSSEDVHAVLQSKMRKMTAFGQVNTAIVYAGHSFREIEVLPTAGVASFSVGNEIAAQFDWHTALADATALLSRLGEWCQYGHLTRGFSIFTTGKTVQHPTRRCQASWTQPGAERALVDDDVLVDAFGVYRLSARLAQKLPIEPPWSLHAANASGFVIATHPASEAWFEDSDLEETNYEQGRDRLAGSLADRTAATLLPNAWIARQEQHARHAAMGFNETTYWERGR